MEQLQPEDILNKILENYATTTYVDEAELKEQIISLLNQPSIEPLSNTFSGEGWTILHYAIINKQESIINCLLEKGINIDIATRTKENVLHLLVQYDTSEEIINTIIENIKNAGKLDKMLSAKNSEGKTPKSYADENKTSFAARKILSLSQAKSDPIANIKEILSAREIKGEAIAELCQWFKNSEQFIKKHIKKFNDNELIKLISVFINIGEISLLNHVLSALKSVPRVIYLNVNKETNPYLLVLSNSNQAILTKLLLYKDLFWSKAENKIWIYTNTNLLFKEDKMDPELLKILINHGVWKDEIENEKLNTLKNNNKLFLKYISENDIAQANKLLKQGVDVNCYNEHGQTATILLEDILINNKHISNHEKYCNTYAFLLMNNGKKGQNYANLDPSIKEKIQNNLDAEHVAVFDERVFLLQRQSTYLPGANEIEEENSNLYSDILRKFYQQVLFDKDLVTYFGPILSVIIHSYPAINLHYDFTNKSTIRTYPTSTDKTKGLAVYQEKKIYLGAKNLIDHDESEANYKEFIGIFCHELTHMACFILWNNGCKPYSESLEDKENRLKFKEITLDLDNRYRLGETLDKIIENVFMFYSQAEHEAELIVRVPQMIAEYGKDEAFARLNKQAPELLKFYLNHVLRACKDFLAEQQNKFAFDYQSILVEIDRRYKIVDDSNVKLHFLTTKIKFLLKMKNYLEAKNCIEVGKELCTSSNGSIDAETYSQFIDEEREYNSKIAREPNTIADSLHNSNNNLISLYSQLMICENNTNPSLLIETLNKLIQNETDPNQKNQFKLLYAIQLMSSSNFEDSSKILEEVTADTKILANSQTDKQEYSSTQKHTNAEFNNTRQSNNHFSFFKKQENHTTLPENESINNQKLNK